MKAEGRVVVSEPLGLKSMVSVELVPLVPLVPAPEVEGLAQGVELPELVGLVQLVPGPACCRAVFSILGS